MNISGKLSLCIAAFVTFMSAAANADTWVYNVTPTAVRSSGTYNAVTFTTTQALTNSAGCASFYVVSTAHQSQFALAILLSAYSTKNNISIYVVSSGCDSTTGGIIVTDVMTDP